MYNSSLAHLDLRGRFENLFDVIIEGKFSKVIREATFPQQPVVERQDIMKAWTLSPHLSKRAEVEEAFQAACVPDILRALPCLRTLRRASVWPF
jgi:hypothetical protein